MKKILDYILSAIYLVFFFTVLLIFDVLQRIAFNFIGKKAHQRVVNVLNFFLCYGWLLTGSTISFEIRPDLPTDKSIIFIANHQSMFDIPGIIWFLRKHTPLFVSKIELAKGIPSISYNLKVGGAALINRKDKVQAMKEIGKLGEYINENKFSAAIFPEGTRSRTGKLKDFASGGVAILLEKCPDAMVVPICIENLSKFNSKGVFPLRSFTRLKWTVLDPISREGQDANAIVAEARRRIEEAGEYE